MVRVRSVQVRLTREQYERIRENARRKGFGTLSSYLRYVALDRDFAVHQKICEVHRLLRSHLDDAAPVTSSQRSCRTRPTLPG